MVLTIIIVLVLLFFLWYLEGIKMKVENLHCAIELHWKNEEINKSPKNAQLYVERGAIHSKYKEYFDSRIDFQVALEIEPDNYNAVYNLAWVNKQLKQYKDAWEYVEKLRELSKERFGEWEDDELITKLIAGMPKD